LTARPSRPTESRRTLPRIRAPEVRCENEGLWADSRMLTTTVNRTLFRCLQ
jgi:hypothetical protein